MKKSKELLELEALRRELDMSIMENMIRLMMLSKKNNIEISVDNIKDLNESDMKEIAMLAMHQQRVLNQLIGVLKALVIFSEGEDKAKYFAELTDYENKNKGPFSEQETNKPGPAASPFSKIDISGMITKKKDKE